MPSLAGCSLLWRDTNLKQSKETFDLPMSSRSHFDLWVKPDSDVKFLAFSESSAKIRKRKFDPQMALLMAFKVTMWWPPPSTFIEIIFLIYFYPDELFRRIHTFGTPVIYYFENFLKLTTIFLGIKAENIKRLEIIRLQSRELTTLNIQCK